MITLAGGKKNKGIQGGKLPKTFVNLVNGSVYNIRFEGRDAAGNNAPEYIVKNIVFDNEKPTLSIIKPYDNAFINRKEISISLSEDLAEGILVLTNVAGSKDENSPHTLILSNELKKIGTIEDKIFNEFEWVDGSTYNLEFDGVDFAGNIADKVVIKNITFDITSPVISIDNLFNSLYIMKIFLI